MAKILLNKTFRSWIELWESLSSDLNTMMTELYSNRLSNPLMTTPVSTVSIQEIGDGRNMTTVLSLTDFAIGTMPGTATAKAIGNIVASFPAGVHLEEITYSSLSLKAPGTVVAAVVALGSVIASGVVAILTGNATFVDRNASTTISTAPSGGTAVASLKNTTAGVQAGIALNVSGSVKEVFLNAAGTWNVDNGSGNLLASGTITIKWIKLGA
jgi:hypothetical protein